MWKTRAHRTSFVGKYKFLACCFDTPPTGYFLTTDLFFFFRYRIKSILALARLGREGQAVSRSRVQLRYPKVGVILRRVARAIKYYAEPMKRIGLIILATLSLLIVLVSYWLGKRSERPTVTRLPTTLSATPAIVPPTASTSTIIPAATPSMAAERNEEAAKIVTGVFNAPISFFGRVEDQNGVPVSEARVE